MESVSANGLHFTGETSTWWSRSGATHGVKGKKDPTFGSHYFCTKRTTGTSLIFPRRNLARKFSPNKPHVSQAGLGYTEIHVHGHWTDGSRTDAEDSYLKYDASLLRFGGGQDPAAKTTIVPGRLKLWLRDPSFASRVSSYAKEVVPYLHTQLAASEEAGNAIGVRTAQSLLKCVEHFVIAIMAKPDTWGSMTIVQCRHPFTSAAFQADAAQLRQSVIEEESKIIAGARSAIDRHAHAVDSANELGRSMHVALNMLERSTAHRPVPSHPVCAMSHVMCTPRQLSATIPSTEWPTDTIPQFAKLFDLKHDYSCCKTPREVHDRWKAVWRPLDISYGDGAVVGGVRVKRGKSWRSQHVHALGKAILDAVSRVRPFVSLFETWDEGDVDEQLQILQQRISR